MNPTRQIFMRLLAAHALDDPSLVMLPASAKEARGRRFRHFFTGRACKRSHHSKRLTSTGGCNECNAEHSRRVAQRPEVKARKRTAARQYWDEHKDEPKWRERDRERVRQGLAKSRKENPGFWRAHAQNRRATKLQATPSWLTDEQRTEIKAVFDDAASRRTKHHVDHIVPLTHPDVCGLHVPWNLQVLTATDNLRKSNKFDGTRDNEGWRD